jgi:excisionase family DNA binding protein
MDGDCELLLSPNEAARRLSLGRTRLYQLLGSGELASVQVGRLRRIPTRALRDYVDGLVAAQAGESRYGQFQTSPVRRVRS